VGSSCIDEVIFTGLVSSHGVSSHPEPHTGELGADIRFLGGAVSGLLSGASSKVREFPQENPGTDVGTDKPDGGHDGNAINGSGGGC
jgi:hypothetical protein